MAKLDIKRLVKRSLERVKQSEHVRDTDPSIVHLEENVLRSIAELEVARAQRITSPLESSRQISGHPGSSSDKPDQNNSDQNETSQTKPAPHDSKTRKAA